MKFPSFVVLLATVSATPMNFYCYYRANGLVALEGAQGSIRDHKAHGVVDGISRWSSERFRAYMAGRMLVVVANTVERDRTAAVRVVGEMRSLVAHYASDG